MCVCSGLLGANRWLRFHGGPAEAEEGTGRTFGRTGATRSGPGEEHQSHQEWSVHLTFLLHVLDEVLYLHRFVPACVLKICPICDFR